MAYFRERTKKNGKKVFTAEVKRKGYPPLIATFDRITDAKVWASAIETDIKRGKRIQNNEATKHTVADMIERYIEFELPKRNTDHKKFDTHLNWWKSKLGFYMLSSINSSLIAQARDELKKEPSIKILNNGDKIEKERSNATINRYLATLSIVFSIARKEWKWIDENPTADVTKLKEPKGRVRFLTDKERKRLIEACKKMLADCKNQPKKKKRIASFYLVVLTALCVGSRAGEVLNLKWDNVDFNQAMFYFMDTKNGEHRAVPIPESIYGFYKEHSKIRRLDSNLVFPNIKGNKPMDTTWFWDKARKLAKLEDFRFHDLRHTAASGLAMDGASLLEIADILGHKTMQMTKRYSHLTKKHTATVLDKMNEKQFKDIEL